MLSASVKAGQSFISSNFQKKLESQSSPSALTQTPEIMQPASLPNGKYLVAVVDSGLEALSFTGTFI